MAEIMTTRTGTGIYEDLEEESAVPDAGIIQDDLEEEYDDKRIYVHKGQERPAETDLIIPAGELAEAEDTIGDKIAQAVENKWEDLTMIDEIIPALEIEEIEVAIVDEIVPAVENTWDDETIPDEIIPAIEINPVETTAEVPGEEEIEQEDEPVTADELPALEMKPVDFTPGDPTEALVPIEPLYTIDYFASQGIKLPVDEIPNDQLARKLKSFTEWLKSMKKLQPDKVDRQMDKETENHIRTAAEHSNDSKEVFTETLAEVYLKQGLDDKAVEVFKKLSLLDPSKSAYFAARIREIKEI
jgi:hypothetical protein